ncbi:PREDICTED: uncharacterized protein LOC108618462 isoform X1 [Drosophila arizonae]|uniref:Uncharacterized protein LOC108618462 isoform X1 n=1 Tax=Drosophila arizonae TaxID=7263 RepID=A0ABM1PRZ1_DROAR|nr:PREDICTED: uncharacterized protein LOC108618462 isoform X1 [Drosophila arizonae]
MQSNAIVSCLLLLFHNVCCYQDNWVEPHAWAELTTTQFNTPGEDACQCQALPPEGKSLATIEDQLALMYFKKFVNTLFNRKKLMHGKTSNVFKRSVLFTLQASQVVELETVEDVRDLDILLNKILDEANDVPLSSDQVDDDYSYTHKEMGVFALIMDIFKDLQKLLQISEVRFMLTVLLIIATGWIVHKRFRYSAIAIVIGGIFLYGYFVTYLECNRKLEVDAVIEVIDSHQESTDNENTNWFSGIYGSLFKESKEKQQREKILKSSKLRMPYCRPDHVFIMYASEIFLKQIEMILEKTTQTISSLNSELSFPFNLIAPFGLIALIGYIIKLIFKYVISPKMWIGVFHGKSGKTSSQPHVTANEMVEDRISGENLKMLLNVIGTTNIVQSQQQQIQLPVSGVQELVEPIEAPPPQTPEKAQSESRQSSEPSPNISNASEDIAHEAGFTVVDDNSDGDPINTF